MNDHETLADLLGHWQRGRLTLDEVMERLLEREQQPEDLLGEVLGLQLHQHLRLGRLERRLAVLEERV